MVKQEKNIFKRLFIRVWYNDIFRLLVLVIPTHMIVTAPISFYALWLMGVNDENLNKISDYVFYFLAFTPICLALIFNDYTNLYKIGRDTDGRVNNFEQK